MDNRSIGEQVTDEIINEQFPTRQMQIDHLKEVSEPGGSGRRAGPAGRSPAV